MSLTKRGCLTDVNANNGWVGEPTPFNTNAQGSTPAYLRSLGGGDRRSHTGEAGGMVDPPWLSSRETSSATRVGCPLTRLTPTTLGVHLHWGSQFTAEKPPAHKRSWPVVGLPMTSPTAGCYFWLVEGNKW